MKSLIIFETVCGIVGFGLVWYGSNWAVALGIFLAMWANNVTMGRVSKQ